MVVVVVGLGNHLPGKSGDGYIGKVVPASNSWNRSPNNCINSTTTLSGLYSLHIQPPSLDQYYPLLFSSRSLRSRLSLCRQPWRLRSCCFGEDTWIKRTMMESFAREVSCLVRVPLPRRLFESIDWLVQLCTVLFDAPSGHNIQEVTLYISSLSVHHTRTPHWCLAAPVSIYFTELMIIP